MKYVLLCLLLPITAHGQRPYWPVPLESLAVGRPKHTHVAVRGIVAYVGHEDDQDLHIRLRSLTDSTSYVVAECMPKMPCLLPNGLPWMPRLGDTVTVYGVSRKDQEHGWWECHPVEAISP